MKEELIEKMRKLMDEIKEKGEELHNEWLDFEDKVIEVRDSFLERIFKIEKEIEKGWLENEISDEDREELVQELEAVKDILYDSIDEWFPEAI